MLPNLRPRVNQSLVALARLSIVSMADCQSSSEADPSASSLSTKLFKAPEAPDKRSLLATGELIKAKKSRRRVAASFFWSACAV